MRRIHTLALALVASVSGCPRPPSPHADAAPAVVRPRPVEVAVVIYDGGLKNGWQDWGWAPKETPPKGPARVRFDKYGGWILAKVGLTGDYGGVVFRVKEPPGEGEFLEVHLLSPTGTTLPQVKVTPDDRLDVGEGWTEIFVPVERLNPSNVPFDRVVIQSFRPFSADYIPIDKIALTQGGPRTPSTLPPPPTREVAMRVDTAGNAVPIHPGIYGMAFSNDKEEWTIGMTGRRWGGNSTSRYNWTLGNATNTGKDWYFENVTYRSQYLPFLQENLDHGVPSALTVPILGWVAKDTTSMGFPKSAFGPMDAFDQWRPEAGNGLRGGKEIAPGPPTTTSVEAPPAFIHRWVESIRSADQARGKRSVHEYILDNEPNLWNSTHRDVHPDPLTYDELLRRAIDYGTAIRTADPDAIIAGPAEWGWTGYLYSAKDAAVSVSLRLDRRAHGDMPLAAWYLKQLRAHEQKTGTRILDVFDLHFYPQGKDVYSPLGGDALDALRIRSTRALWDPTYVDESWIHEAVQLIPRMKQWVAENSPGVGISIGEWSFGGEGRMSGALATAEALGRFGQLEVTSAYYWVHPPPGSPSYWAFRAYRDFDGHGGRFLDFSVPTSAVPGTSLFASKDEHGTHYVLVALNTMPDAVARARIDAPACDHAQKREAFQFTGAAIGFGPPKSLPNDGPILLDLPPSSITVIDVHLGA